MSQPLASQDVLNGEIYHEITTMTNQTHIKKIGKNSVSSCNVSVNKIKYKILKNDKISKL